MKSTRKPLPLFLACLLPALAQPARAIGLGELNVLSPLGQPLRAELRLIREKGEELDPSCLKAAPGADGDDLPWIRSIRLSVAGDRVQIRTRDAVQHPIAMLGLRLVCGSEVRRDYTLMLQPPRGGADIPLFEAIDPPIAEAAGPAVPETTRPPEPGTALRAAPHKTPAALPGPRHASRPHRPLSRMEVPPSQPGLQAPQGTASTQRKPSPLPPERDRLVIGGASGDGFAPLHLSLSLANPPVTSAQPDLDSTSREHRTLAAIDERIAAQLELDEKIKRLEEYEVMLRERIDRLGLAPAPLAHGAPPPAPVPAPAPSLPAQGHAPEAGEDRLPPWTLPAAGGGVLALMLLGLGLMRRKGSVGKSAGAPGSGDSVLSEVPTSALGPISYAPAITVGTVAPGAVPPVQPALAVPPAFEPPRQEHAHPEWSEPTFAPAHPIPFDETVDEQDSALELADIMLSFGRTQGAAETLADYIRGNPRQAVKPWLKLLEVYHSAGMQPEYEALARQLNKTFNVKTVSWSDFGAARSGGDSVEQMPHIMETLQNLWGTRNAQVYIHQLLRDTRNGTRQGFSLGVVDELLLLLAVLEDELGPYKPQIELTLVEDDKHTFAAA